MRGHGYSSGSHGPCRVTALWQQNLSIFLFPIKKLGERTNWRFEARGALQFSDQNAGVSALDYDLGILCHHTSQKRAYPRSVVRYCELSNVVDIY